ncbi:E3 ubiquitin-protein ligase Mdm2-like [Dromiciops gliroides]|uniref:E3 ubiquitin-protein ligase Mdm2-like n=1 Tax=Dromiciops gliroides TaxID=33562 RepID=UPI001CC42018|nr:E3 ubiquitin-protein ligase Mdm2-like [Dromiciops gliroides]
MPCGKAGNPEEAKSSIAYPSSQEPVQEPGEEHPPPIVDTGLATSGRPCEAENNVDEPRPSGDCKKLKSSVSHSSGGCCGGSRPSSPDNQADSASDRFSVEYDVDSLDSEDFAINPQREELTLEGACAEGDPAQPQQPSSSGIDWEPGPSHAQTGGRPAQGSNPQEPPEQAVLAPCSQGASGDSPPAPFQVGTRHSMNFQEPCILCLSEPKDCCMVHGVTGHVVTCFMCASKLRQRRKPCPVCRLPIDHIIFIYLL